MYLFITVYSLHCSALLQTASSSQPAGMTYILECNCLFMVASDEVRCFFVVVFWISVGTGTGCQEGRKQLENTLVVEHPGNVGLTVFHVLTG